MRPARLLILLTLILTGLLVVPQTIGPAHANPFTGAVCIEDFTSVPVTNPTPCNHVLSGSTPVAPTFDGPSLTPNHQVQIGLYVNGSDQLNGWDITLKVDHTLLVPAFRTSSVVDPTHSIVGPENIAGASLSVIVLCVQGISVTGTCLSTDNIDTLHYSVVGGKTIASPSSGLLFTALYNITGQTPAGGLTIGYQTGCVGAVSVPGECITILSGTPTPDPEIPMTATFNNSGTPSTGGTGASGVPFVTLSANPTSLALLVGQSKPVTLTATAQNGWPGPALCAPPTPGCSTDSVLFTEMHSTGLSVGLAPGTTCTTSGTSCSTPAIGIKAPTTNGNYSVTFFADYVANSFTTGQNSTLSGSITVFVRVMDFSWVLSPTSVNVVSGGPASALSTGTVTSLNGFAGTVSVTSVPVPGLTITFNPASVPVTAGGSGLSQISLSTAAAAGTVFNVVTRATTTGLTTAKTATLKVTVVSGGALNITSTVVTCAPSSVTVGTATSCTATVTDTAPKPTNPTGTVTFSNGGAAGSFASTTCTLTNSGSNAATCASSVSYTPSAASGQSISGSYDGDPSHATSTSSAFALTVTKTSPTIATVIENSTNVAVTSITEGTTVHDTAIMTGGFQAGGTVTYTEFSNGACTGKGTVLSFVTVAAGVIPNSTMTIPSPAGSYSFNATYSGDSNNSNAASVCETLTVNPVPPNFVITANPVGVTVVPGAKANSTITVMATGGFTGVVSLSAAVSSGLTSVFNSNSITGSGTSILTITASPSVSAGSYKVNVTGTSGSLVHIITVAVIVFNFTITPSQSTVSQVDAGSHGSVTITIAALGGSSGAVSLIYSSDAGLTCTLTPNTVTAGVSSGSSTLACGSSSYGNYNVIVTGNSTSLTHSTGSILFEVVDFSITASPIIVSPVNLGTLANSTITITSLNGYSKTVSLSGSGSSSVALIIKFSSSSITGSGSSKLSVGAYDAADYTVTVTASETGLTHSVDIKFSFLGLGLAPAPNSLTIIVGSSATSTVTVSSLNGFVGHVSLGASLAYPGLLSLSLSQTGVDLVNGGSVQTVLNVTVSSAAFPYDYVVNITARNGSMVIWTAVTVTVPQPGFTITASSTMLQGIEARASVTVTLTVSPQKGFTGDVTLTVVPASGMIASTSPTVITSGSGTSTLTMKALTSGSYSVTVTATSGALSHPITVTLSANDFAMILNPSGSLTFDPGSTATSTITISSQNGFTGTVTLSVQTPSALSIQLTPSAINGGSGTSTLKVTGSEPGTYNVTISAMSGTLLHASIIRVTVSQPPSGVFGLNSPEFYVAIAVVIVVLLAALLLVFRARARRGK